MVIPLQRHDYIHVVLSVTYSIMYTQLLQRVENTNMVHVLAIALAPQFTHYVCNCLIELYHIEKQRVFGNRYNQVHLSLLCLDYVLIQEKTLPYPTKYTGDCS